MGHLQEMAELSDVRNKRSLVRLTA